VTENDISVRPLRPGDDRSSFRRGDPDLERFFVKFAGQNQFKHHLGQTYVAVQNALIAGYATVSAGHIQAEALTKKLRKRLPRYPLPILRLARLGVDERFAGQGQGVGLKLLKSAFLLAREMEQLAGCVGIVVDAKPNAVPFYERFGFVSFDPLEGALGERPMPVTMFLSLGSIPY
jgi:GNAT superfamily N-acetyltransferase